MKVYFDTNVLIAAVRPTHIHHRASYAVLDRVIRGVISGCVSGQGLAEFYSVLTRTPFVPRALPDEAALVAERTIVRLFELVDIPSASYRAAIATCAARGWRGGRVNDAVHVQAARYAVCEVVCTWNAADFESVRGEFAGQIVTPLSL